MESRSDRQTPEGLVQTWADAFYEAARNGRSTDAVAVDGESANDATVRWIEMVADAHGLEAAGLFGGKANELLFAAADLGRAERAARGLWGWQARSTVKDARARLEAAEAAIREWSAIPEALGHLREVNPALYEELERGAARRLRDEFGVGGQRGEATREPVGKPSPLHAHEVTADDAAFIRMLAESDFDDAFIVELPSGNVVNGAELRRWVQSHEG